METVCSVAVAIAIALWIRRRVRQDALQRADSAVARGPIVRSSVAVAGGATVSAGSRRQGVDAGVESAVGGSRASQTFDRRSVAGRAVTVSTAGTVLHLDEQGGTVLPEARRWLSLLAGLCDLYLITQVRDEEQAQRVQQALQRGGVFDCGVSPVKSLVCSTAVGRTAMARQLEAVMHVDTDPTVVHSLHRFVAGLVLVGAEHPSVAELTNVAVVDLNGLAEFFGCASAGPAH